MATRRDETHIKSGCLTIRRTRYRSGEQKSRLSFIVALVGTSATLLGLFLTAIGTISIQVIGDGQIPLNIEPADNIEPDRHPPSTIELGMLFEKEPDVELPDSEANTSSVKSTDCEANPGDLASLQNAITEVLLLAPHGYEEGTSIEALAAVLVEEDPAGRFTLELRGHGDSEIEALEMAEAVRLQLITLGVTETLCGTATERILTSAGDVSAARKLRTEGLSLLQVLADYG